MSTWAWIVIAVVVAAAVVAIALAMKARARRKRLRSRFGPEYQRTVDTTGNRRAAERELGERTKRRDELEIRPLPTGARERYAGEWRQVQSGFVDQPETSVDEADHLVTRVMRECGYPVDDFEAQVAIVSVDHPRVVENYRAAHGVYERNRTRSATTEDLREAVVRYRSLFDELLAPDDGAGTAPAPRDAAARGRG